MRTIFYNDNEKRFRAGWRILITTMLAFSILILLAAFIPWQLGFQVVLAAAVLLVLFFASKNIDKRSFHEFGFELNQSWFKDFLAGNGMAIIAMGAIVLFARQMGWFTLVGVDFTLFEPKFLIGLFSSLLFMIAVSVWEEAYFRSYLITNIKEGMQFNRLDNRIPIVIAVLLSSFIFGFAHITNPNASVISSLNITLAGIVLAYPYIVTKSIAIPVGMHLSWNYFQSVVFGLPVSGQPLEPSILRFETPGPEIYTGGNFGPEAGIIGLLGLIFMWSLSYFYIVRFYKK